MHQRDAHEWLRGPVSIVGGIPDLDVVIVARRCLDADAQRASTPRRTRGRGALRALIARCGDDLGDDEATTWDACEGVLFVASDQHGNETDVSVDRLRAWLPQALGRTVTIQDPPAR